MKIAYLKSIGNGQITIPKAWRKLLQFDDQPIKATFDGARVIIEPLHEVVQDWEISKVQMNHLSPEKIEALQAMRADYFESKKHEFLTSSQLFQSFTED